jgi:hypothetical protein
MKALWRRNEQALDFTRESIWILLGQPHGVGKLSVLLLSLHSAFLGEASMANACFGMASCWLKSLDISLVTNCVTWLRHFG